MPFAQLGSIWSKDRREMCKLGRIPAHALIYQQLPECIGDMSLTTNYMSDPHGTIITPWSDIASGVKTTKRLQWNLGQEQAVALHETTQSINQHVADLFQEHLPQNHCCDDRCLFEGTLEQCLSKPLSEKRVWVQSVQWAQETATAERGNENNQMRQTMANWPLGED